MTYSESSLIWKEIGIAKNILVNCHAKPDVDSVSSALAFRKVLIDLGKNVTVICPHEPPSVLRYLEGWESIQKVNFSEFDYSLYDLLVLLDTDSWGRVTGSEDISVPNIKKIVIDHHKDNTKIGEINLVDPGSGSTSEVLYSLFGDFGITVDRVVGEAIVSGIAGDSSGFRNTGAGTRAFRIVADLMEKGVDKSQIITNIYGTMTLGSLSLLGEVLRLMKTDKQNKFVWAAIPFEIYSKYSDSSALELYSGTFFRSVIDTEFGVMFLEKEKGLINMSIKARVDYDVSGIAQALGGGGHKRAGGGMIECRDFEVTISECLQKIRNIAIISQ